MRLVKLLTARNFHLLLAFYLVFVPPLQGVLHYQKTVLSYPHQQGIINPYGDPDQWLRLTQVKQWLGGSGFYDHSVRHTNAPYGGVETHWTRPLDFLLAGMSWLMPHELPLDVRLLLVSVWWPLVAGMAAFLLMSRAASRLSGQSLAYVAVALCLFANPVMTIGAPTSVFAAGNTDHHGLLLTLWCGVLYVLLSPLSAAGSVVMGILLGLMIWVSPEALMLYAAVGTWLGLYALKEEGGMRRLRILSCAAALVATGGLLIEAPPAQTLSHVRYDTLSIVYVTLLWLVFAGAAFLEAAFKMAGGQWKRLCLSASAVAAISFLMVLIFPEVVRGPLAEVDPYILSYFLPNTQEAQPLWEWQHFDFRHVYQIALAFYLLAVAWKKSDARFVGTMAFLSAATFLMVCFEVRWLYYLFPLCVVAIAALLPLLAGGWRAYIFCLFLAIPAFMQEKPKTAAALSPEVSACLDEATYIVQTRQLPALLGKKEGTLVVDERTEGSVLFFTGYSIIAGNYHREGEGLRELYLGILKAPTAEAAKPVLQRRKVLAIIVCPERYPKESWLSSLSDAKKRPAWLKPVRGNIKWMKKEGLKPLIFRLSISSR